jgi:ABC-type multidrug transport system fused ATPase/permease subunit
MENTPRENVITGILLITCGPLVMLYLVPKFFGRMDHQSRFVQDFDSWFIPALYEFIHQAIPLFLAGTAIVLLLVTCFFGLRFYFQDRREARELFYWRFEKRIEARWNEALQRIDTKQQRKIEELSNETKKLKEKLETHALITNDTQQLNDTVEHLV